MCFDDDAHPPIPLSENSGAHGEEVTLTARDGTRFMGYLAEPGGDAEAQLLILPDIRGLHDFYRELALRFADVGKRALAIDYFARTAPDNNRDSSFEYMPHVQQMTQETFGADLDAGIEYLKRGDGARLPTFTLGFCMGGALSFWAGKQHPELDGVIGFYGILTGTRGAVTPVVDWADQIKPAVLGLFGGDDQAIPPDAIARFEEGLKAGGNGSEVVVYPGAPHSFFDRRAEAFAQESADAWSRIQGFIAGHSMSRV